MKHILWLALCAGALGLSGCQTEPRTTPAYLAAVELRGNTPGQIGPVVIAVFKDHHFTVARRRYTAFVFEKEASRMDNLAYGDWISDKPVWLRVKAELVPLSEAHFRLQCSPVLVQDKNESLEHELKVTFRKAPYQKLLEEVARRLQGEPIAGPGPK